MISALNNKPRVSNLLQLVCLMDNTKTGGVHVYFKTKATTTGWDAARKIFL